MTNAQAILLHLNSSFIDMFAAEQNIFRNIMVLDMIDPSKKTIWIPYTPNVSSDA